jgi:hypothetical protein
MTGSDTSDEQLAVWAGSDAVSTTACCRSPSRANLSPGARHYDCARPIAGLMHDIYATINRN